MSELPLKFLEDLHPALSTVLQSLLEQAGRLVLGFRRLLPDLDHCRSLSAVEHVRVDFLPDGTENFQGFFALAHAKSMTESGCGDNAERLRRTW